MSPVSGPSLIVAALCAPLTGVSMRRKGLLHGVTMEAIVKAWPSHCAVAACGAKNIRLIQSGEYLVQWPPKLRGLPKTLDRCRPCWEATGRKRPLSEFKKDPFMKEEAS